MAGFVRYNGKERIHVHPDRACVEGARVDDDAEIRFVDLHIGAQNLPAWGIKLNTR